MSAVEYSRICYYAAGKRERLTFSSMEEAKTEARLNANLLSRGDSAALQLTGQDRLIYGRAIDGDDVLTPKPPENPVITALNARAEPEGSFSSAMS